MADTISFGRPYIPNSDLPERFRLNAPLNPVDVSTFLARKPLLRLRSGLRSEAICPC